MNTIISFKNINLFMHQRYGLDTDTFLSQYVDNEQVFTKTMEDTYWEFTQTEVRKDKVIATNPYPTKPEEFDLGACKKPKDIKELSMHLSKTYHTRKELLIKQHGRMMELQQQKEVTTQPDRLTELGRLKSKQKVTEQAQEQ